MKHEKWRKTCQKALFEFIKKNLFVSGDPGWNWRSSLSILVFNCQVCNQAFYSTVNRNSVLKHFSREHGIKDLATAQKYAKLKVFL